MANKSKSPSTNTQTNTAKPKKPIPLDPPDRGKPQRGWDNGTR